MAGRSLDRTPTPLCTGGTSRAWWRKERRAIGALNTLKFQPNAQFAVLWNLLFPCLRLQTNSWKYNLVEHLYGKNVSHFPHGPVVVIRPPPSHAHFDSTLDESRVSWLHIRMKHHGNMNFFWGHGNLEPKTHRLRKNGTCSDLITKGQRFSSIPHLLKGAPVGRQHPGLTSWCRRKKPILKNDKR